MNLCLLSEASSRSIYTYLALGSVVTPLGHIALPLVVNPADGAVLRDGDGVLGIANRRVALGMERVRRHIILGNVIESVLRDRAASGKNSLSSLWNDVIGARPRKYLSVKWLFDTMAASL